MFEVDAQGKVKGNANMHGWLATGVPGTAAGLDLILTRYGTRSLRQALSPAIALCEEGQYAAALQNIAPGARPNGKNSQAGPLELKRNRALGGLLKQLASRNSTESFYRGDIADTIAAAFAQNGGLVTKQDLASYHAQEVTPVKIEWGGSVFHTVPLTATGVLVFEAMAILRELGWEKLPAAQQRHAKLEALRIAWADRLRTFGDPTQVKDPTDLLLSRPHLKAMAGQVRAALKAGRPVPLEVQRSLADGTINLSAGDRHGNMIAITLTHGNAFGARVVVEELGMVLGHGMSRFDPRPGLPNSVGPGKRPQHNMCPSIVTRAGRAVLAIGGAGGVRIQNSVYEVLLQHSILGRPMDAAIAAPRLHTDGTLRLGLEKIHSAEEESFFKKIGYETVRGSTANISAVTFDPRTSDPRAFARGP